MRFSRYAVALRGAGTQQIVKVHDANGNAGLDNEHRGDLGAVQHFEQLADELIGPHGFGTTRHHVLDAGFKQIGAHVTPQVAVGDNAEQVALVVGDADAAEALRRHLDDRLRHPRAGLGDRHGARRCA